MLDVLAEEGRRVSTLLKIDNDFRYVIHTFKIVIIYIVVIMLNVGAERIGSRNGYPIPSSAIC